MSESLTPAEGAKQQSLLFQNEQGNVWRKSGVGLGLRLVGIGLSTLATFGDVPPSFASSELAPPLPTPTATTPEQMQQQTGSPDLPIVGGFPVPTQQKVQLPENGISVVEVDGLNLRQAPVNGKPITQLPKDSVLTILPEDPNTPLPSGWLKVQAPDGTTIGYVATTLDEHTYSTAITNTTTTLPPDIQAQFVTTETVSIPKAPATVDLKELYNDTAIGGGGDDINLETQIARPWGESVTPITKHPIVDGKPTIEITGIKSPFIPPKDTHHALKRALSTAALATSGTEEFEIVNVANLAGLTSKSAVNMLVGVKQSENWLDVTTRSGDIFTITRFQLDKDGNIVSNSAQIGEMSWEGFVQYSGEIPSAKEYAQKLTDMGGTDPDTLNQEVADMEQFGVFVPDEDGGYFVPKLNRSDILKTGYTDPYPYNGIIYTIENGTLWADVYDTHGNHIKEFQSTPATHNSQGTDTGEYGWEEVVEEENMTTTIELATNKQLIIYDPEQDVYIASDATTFSGIEEEDKLRAVAPSGKLEEAFIVPKAHNGSLGIGTIENWPSSNDLPSESVIPVVYTGQISKQSINTPDGQQTLYTTQILMPLDSESTKYALYDVIYTASYPETDELIIPRVSLQWGGGTAKFYDIATTEQQVQKRRGIPGFVDIDSGDYDNLDQYANKHPKAARRAQAWKKVLMRYADNSSRLNKIGEQIQGTKSASWSTERTKKLIDELNLEFPPNGSILGSASNFQ